MEKLWKRMDGKTAATIVGGAALGAGLVALGFELAQIPSTADRAVHAFERGYTDAGKCLDGTPYDPSEGAFVAVHHDTQSGMNIVSAVPRDANSQQPSVLSFSVGPNSHFLPADHNTLAFALQAGCPDATSGQ